jgi:CubicO group peptidase (beta-lactamase class C family)
MRAQRIFISIGLILTAVLPAWAQLDLKPTLEAAREEHNLSAMGAVVINNGEIGEPCVTGLIGRGMPKPVPADARWHLGSCGKSMTAMLAAVMIERGDLRWDTTLEEAFADTDIKVHEGYRQVTIDQLLRHRGGLAGNLIQSPIWGRLRMQGGPATEQRCLIAQTCLAEPPAHEPGTEFLYANEGYVIVGHILERIADKPYEELMAEEIFAPLGLTSAGFGPPPDESDPRGHRWNTPLPPHRLADNPEGLSPAGRIHMSLHDWARYAQAHLRAARGEAYELISEASYRRMQDALPEQHYALGWGNGTRKWARGPVLSHAGSNTMWRAEVWIAPNRNAALLIAANNGTERAKDGINDALKAIISSLWPRE